MKLMKPVYLRWLRQQVCAVRVPSPHGHADASPCDGVVNYNDRCRIRDKLSHGPRRPICPTCNAVLMRGARDALLGAQTIPGVHLGELSIVELLLVILVQYLVRRIVPTESRGGERA